MARQVYSSFHYADVWRANVVRNSNTVKSTATETGFYDHSLWEEAKTKGDAAIKKLIDEGMTGASVTVVLIGSETHTRKWVLYEIQQSVASMGIVAIHINSIQDQNRNTKFAGPNPLDELQISSGPLAGRRLSSLYKTYDWIGDNGYQNAGTWIEDAAEAEGR
jgi:hypothetical protein